MVNEHRIIIIQAAGNFGPFLSSMRDDTFESNDEMITIGSLFTNGMKRIVEKENDDNPKFLWYYSSRGPLPNGARGITCVAPADAVVENPQWHSMKKIIFTGTSCAAPNAAGAIACLLSGLKANGMEYSPAMIKMALSNTAFLPDGGDRLEFGNGIIQINEAFEYLKTFKENFPRIVFPQLSIRSKEKGIVVYKTKNLSFINKYNIKVQGYSECHQQQPSWILKLSSENHTHVEYSKIVTNNSFNVKINASNLEPGSIYYSEIHGFDPLNSSLGPIFHLPITVIVPENVVNYSIQKEIFIQPPSIFKYFINPPINSFKCSIKLIDPKNGNIFLEKTIKKDEDVSKNYFTPNESTLPWRADIKWKKILEIYIFQEMFVEKGFNLKANLQISFDQWKFSGIQWVLVRAII